MNRMTNLFDKDKKTENRTRHEAFRAYYWEKQTETIFKMSVWFLVICAIGLFIFVPFEHVKYPELGRLKYGLGVIGHLVTLCFAKWLIGTKRLVSSKKAIVLERFTFAVGLVYLSWGILGMYIAIKENEAPILLIYLILLAAITAFLYLPLSHFVWMVVLSYSLATAVFLTNREHKLDATSSVCAVIMMLIFGVLSNTRYKFGRDRFEFERENNRLIDEQIAQNEELESQNEELIAINQELNDTTDKLTQALEEIENAAKAQKMFTSAMNHELRAPLNGIIGTIQVMQMSDKYDDAGRQYLSQCMTMSQSLLNIVNDLLDYAKMDAGEFEILPAAFDLHEVIANVDDMFKNQAENKGLKLIFDIPDDMVCGLYGDDFRIQQVISNIVSNGIKYTDEGSVTVSASYADDTLRFVISDTGQGMTEESMKDLFVPFRRIAESKNKKIQGTGLGMSIVMNLVEKMNGKISVDSIYGKGTTFTLLIPSKITDENNIWGNPANETDSSEEAQAIDLSGKIILYVDDTKMNLKIVDKLITDTNVKLTATGSPFEGLDLAKSNKYDVIMLDHQMPEMTGPELFEAIRRESAQNADTPVIIFTGNAGTGAEEKYKEMGFAGYICKPVLKDKLLEELKKVMKN